MKDKLEELESRIGYHFQNTDLLRTAMTHSSYINEHHLEKHQSNERLEFLGDAVLELVSSEFLYKEHPKVSEGELTRTRASMVCEPSLAFCARDPVSYTHLDVYKRQVGVSAGCDETAGCRKNSC